MPEEDFIKFSMRENFMPSSYTPPALKVYYSGACRVQIRFPKTKKRRIRKKWAKNPRNWKAMLYYLKNESTFIAHPSFKPAVEKIKAEIAARSPGVLDPLSHPVHHMPEVGGDGAQFRGMGKPPAV